MATAIRTGDAVAQATPNVTTRHAGYLFHPVIDFILAGGGSMLLALPIILLIHDKKAVEATALGWGLVLSNVLNFPHFANSYQLLYTGIGKANLRCGLDTESPFSLHLGRIHRARTDPRLHVPCVLPR